MSPPRTAPQAVQFVLLHSPVVGPATWAPVADRLAHLGHPAVVPSLLAVGAGEPPFWPRVVEAVTAALRHEPPDRPVALVAHSNAGLFVPVIRQALDRPVVGSVFVDAVVPARSGSTPVADAEFLPFLAGLADAGGRLPRWTEWWDEADLGPLFPDAGTQRLVTAEQPRLPLAYFEQRVPVPDGWDDHPCAYVWFGEPYDKVAAEAAQRGWVVRHQPGGHLHQLVEPTAVAELLVSLTLSKT